MKKKILLLNDLPGYGKVALTTAIPLLSRMGHHVFNLPTALVSNTLDWGKFHIQDTTDYIKNSLKVWEELDFHFDAVSTGFLASEEQARFLAEYCGKLKEQGTLIFADPIMADNGKLYNGISDRKILHMKELVRVADYIVPNYTEAVYLANMEYRPNGLTESEAADLVQNLRKAGASSIAITSARVEGSPAVITYDASEDRITILPYEEVKARFPGTGDIFSALFMAAILDGQNVSTSAQSAMTTIESMITQYQTLPETYKGLPVEQMF
ncbi:MAG: pyridoxamine kinase [Clostridiales bacterium]|nr:pyridoxamine kinase [Candidatus Blautia equi]